MVAGTPGLPDAARADDEAKQQRELHLDALIARPRNCSAATGITFISTR